MNNPKVLILVTLCLLFLVGCQQDEPLSPHASQREVTEAWQLFYKTNGAQPQSFSVDADLGATIEGKQGFTYIIPPHAFVNKFGRIVSGEVTVQICEFPALSDLFLTGLHTMTFLGPLLTTGSFKFEASQDGEVLTVSRSENVRVLIPAYQEIGTFSDTLYAYKWGNRGAWIDTLYGFQYMIAPVCPLRPELGNKYEMEFSGRGIFSCAIHANFHFRNTVHPNTSFSVKLRGASTEQTRVVMVIKGLPGLVELPLFDGMSKHTPDFSIYEGMEGRIIALSIEDGDLKFGYKDVTITNQDSFEVEVTSGKLKGLKKLIDNPF